MPTPLLETKLYLPSPRHGLVPRPRLSDALDRGARSKLMLVSAPAGFGKTTLLAEWLAAGPASPADPRSVAWLSLDRSDNDPVTFWSYLVAALQTVAPGVGVSALALLREPQPPPIEVLLTTLLNDLGAEDGEIVLVLDDFHVIDARDVHDAMAFLLDHLPPTLHVVMAGRADPALPLARLRARGELAEIRGADLRFTADETAAYLNERMGLELSERDVTALEGRTEGWIAALQLAALSMQGREDMTGFIAGFTGDDRYVVDYLVEEVVQRQSDRVQDFLLRTSVLGRLSGPLCDEVTGQDGGKVMLEALDRANLFLVPLDDRRQWYRYHQLFADVLHARLLDERPDEVPDLHRRASRWCEQNGERDVAIGHALAAADFERAADLIELALPDLRRDRHEGKLVSLLAKIPDDLLVTRPVLSNAYGGAMLSSGRIEGVEERLRDAQRWFDEPDHERGGMVFVDEEELRRVPAGVAVHRAGLALVQGDPAATVAHAQRALELLAEHDELGRGAATALIGLASWGRGDLEKAHESYVTCLGSMRRAGHLADIQGLSIALADIQITLGRLHEAMRTYEQALQLAPERVPPLRGTADMYVGLSLLHRERNDLPTAAELLRRSETLGEHVALPQNPYRWRVAMARIREAEGDLAGAVELLDEAERVYTGDFSPDVRPVPAMRARVWITQGRIDDALGWLHGQGLSADDDLDYLREFEHVTLARALLGRAATEDGRSLDEASELLAGLLGAAETGRRTGSVIEVLVLQSLAHRIRGDLPAALVPLERALTLAEPEGYVRIFVDEGQPMATLLKAAAKRGIAKGYVGRLLAALASTSESPVDQGRLVDALSERELDVLRLLGSDLDGPDIARQLTVSLNTIRTHTKSIYAKLGVNSRRTAVRRAKELGLLARDHDRRP